MRPLSFIALLCTWQHSVVKFYFSIIFRNDCIESNPRVIKTIRLHKINLDPWIFDSDIKVIHLVRDPRAVYASMAQRPKTWKGSLDHVDGMCERMLTDIILGSKLPSERYVLYSSTNIITMFVCLLGQPPEREIRHPYWNLTYSDLKNGKSLWNFMK